MNLSSSTRTVLIFGGAGFVGSNWAHHLLTRSNANIHIFDNLSRRKVEHNLQWLQQLAKGTNRLKVSVADIRDARAVEKAVYGATEIYHFAAQVAVTTSLDDPRADFEINAGGTLNILEAARRCGSRPFLLFTSTNKVYGHIASPHKADGLSDRHICTERDSIRETQPLDFYSPYGCSKGTADQYVHDYSRIFGVPSVVFRMSCIAGPRQFGNEDQGWVAHFVYSALQGKTISIYGDGRQVRDVLAVQDLVRAFDAAYQHREKTSGQIYNIGGGRNHTISLLELIGVMERTLQVRIKYRFRPARPGDQPVYITDFSKFTQHARWLPESNVEQTVRSIVCWHSNHRHLFAPAEFAPPGKLSSQAIREIAS